jgi:hypothetical protein
MKAVECGRSSLLILLEAHDEILGKSKLPELQELHVRDLQHRLRNCHREHFADLNAVWLHEPLIPSPGHDSLEPTEPMKVITFIDRSTNS